VSLHWPPECWSPSPSSYPKAEEKCPRCDDKDCLGKAVFYPDAGFNICRAALSGRNCSGE